MSLVLIRATEGGMDGRGFLANVTQDSERVKSSIVRADGWLSRVDEVAEVVKIDIPAQGGARS